MSPAPAGGETATAALRSIERGGREAGAAALYHNAAKLETDTRPIHRNPAGAPPRTAACDFVCKGVAARRADRPLRGNPPWGLRTRLYPRRRRVVRPAW